MARERASQGMKYALAALLASSANMDIDHLPGIAGERPSVPKFNGRSLSPDDMKARGYVFARGSWWRKEKARERGIL